MALHYDPFLSGEIRAFFQDLIRNGDLAEIVQVSAPPQSDDVVLIEQQMTTKIAGVFRQTFAMTLGVRIAAFNAQTERTENTLGGLQFIGKLFQLDQGLHPSEQLFWKNRLAQKIVGAGFNAAHAIFAFAESG